MKLSTSEIDSYLENTTFGAELEVPNWDTTRPLDGLGDLCDREWELINHKGISNDPRGELNLIGAEIKVCPTDTEQELVDRILQIWEKIGWPDITAGPTLHTHVRVPAMFFDENVHILKWLMEYTHKWLPELLPIISPLPPMSDFKDLQGDVKKRLVQFFRAKYKHRHQLIKEIQVQRAQGARNFKECVEALTVRDKRGNPSWNIFSRTTVNFGRLRATAGGTLEFRMFNLTKDPEEIQALAEFGLRYLRCALRDGNPLEEFDGVRFPPLLDWKKHPVWCNPQCVDIQILTEMKEKGRKGEVRERVTANYRQLLVDRKITLADLGYPAFWKNHFEPALYQELLEHARETEGKPDERYGDVDLGLDVLDMFGGE
jgi:hypothetical protein